MQHTRVVRALVFALGSAAFLQCATLPEFAADVCGNGVKDDGEDCDDITTSTQCGAPDTTGACRFVCSVTTDAGDGGTTTTGDALCPAGYGCGTDFICRRRDVTQGYVPATAVAVGADRIVAADLAGTGKASVLAVSRDALDQGYPRLLAFDRTGARTADQTLQGSFGLGSVADVDLDGHDDVLFSRIDGLLLGLGEDETTLNPVAADAIALPAFAHVTLLTVPGSASLVSAGARSSELLALVSNLSDASHDPGHSYLFGTDVNVGPLADFDATWPATPTAGSIASGFGNRTSTLPDPDFQCERVVFAQLGGHQIDSVQPCCPLASLSNKNAGCSDSGNRLLGGAAGTRDLLAQTLAPIAYGPWSLDVDGDARIDVLVATRNPGSSLQLEVAFAGEVVPTSADPASRSLYATPPVNGAPATGAQRTTVLPLYDGTPTAELDTLLDVGVETRSVQVIDAENRVTFEPRRVLTFVDALFVAHAFYATDAADAGYTLSAIRASTWTSARLASFNGDDALDLIGGRERSVDLDVGLGTADLGLNLTSVRTGLSADGLTLADVDGDGNEDVLLTSNVGQSSSALSILFGRTGSFPSEISTLGEFERVTQTAAAPLAFANQLTQDSAADVGIVTRRFEGDPGPNRPASDSVTVLRSVGGRVPLSLYALGGKSDATPPQSITARPIASALVRRLGGSDLVAIGSENVATGASERFRLWSGPVQTSDTRVRLGNAVLGAELDVDAQIGTDGDPAVGDFGPNALLTPIDLDGDGNQELAGVTTDRTLTQPLVLVASFGGAGYTLSRAPEALPSALFRVFGVTAVDATDDGREDLVVLLASAPDFQNGGDTDQLDLSARQAAFLVVPNVAGSLVPSAAVVLSPPGNPRALTAGRIDGPQAAARLVVATTTGIYIYRNGTFSTLYQEANQRGLAPATRSLAVADVTGDGVDDLVVGTHDRVTVLRAPTVNP